MNKDFNKEELEILYHLVCDEMEFQKMNYDDDVYYKLKSLLRKLEVKKWSVLIVAVWIIAISLYYTISIFVLSVVNKWLKN